MTDKTDALVELINGAGGKWNVAEAVAAWMLNRFREGDPEIAEARMLMNFGMQLREALAAPAEGGQGEAKDPTGFSVAMVLDEANNWTARSTGKQMLLNYAAMLTAPPVASVDVGSSPADSIALTTIIGLVAEMDNFADVADRCQLTEGNAPVAIRAWRERLLTLIDSAGGAKGEKPFKAPGEWFPLTVMGQPMREFAPGRWEYASWPSEAPQPAEGDGAVGEMVVSTDGTITMSVPPPDFAAGRYTLYAGAPPAASLDVERLRRLFNRVNRRLEETNLPVGYALARSWESDLHRLLIDSAGGAKGEELITVQQTWEWAGGNPGIKATKQELIDALRTLDEVCDDADTPHPAEGDGAVARHVKVLRDFASCYGVGSESGDAIRAAIAALSRPAATAVPDAERRHIERAIRVLRRDYESPLADAVESIYKQSIAAAPAAPKGDDDKVLWGIVANAGRLSSKRQPRWAHVVDATGRGSNSSAELCRRFDFDPDAQVGGAGSDDEDAAPKGGVVDEAMARIGELIRMQDNRITDSPIFIVQQKRRICGVNADYTNNFEWLDPRDSSEVYDDVGKAEKDAERAAEGLAPIEWKQGGYIDIWEFVTACFSEQGCKDYIAINGHNLCEPRIYAAGSYRNKEWREVRAYLAALATGEQS